MELSKHLQHILCLGIASASIFGLISASSLNASANRHQHHSTSYVTAMPNSSNYGAAKANRRSAQNMQDISQYQHLNLTRRGQAAKYNRQVAAHQINVLNDQSNKLSKQIKNLKGQIQKLSQQKPMNTKIIHSLYGKLIAAEGQQKILRNAVHDFQRAKFSNTKQNQHVIKQHKSAKINFYNLTAPIGTSGNAFAPLTLDYAPRQLEFNVNGQPISVTPTPLMLSNSIPDNVAIIETYLANYLGGDNVYTTNLQICKDLMKSRRGHPIQINLRQGNPRQLMNKPNHNDQQILELSYQSNLVLI